MLDQRQSCNGHHHQQQRAPPVSAGSRKQVRFESPLITACRKITLPSPPATPLLSPPRSPAVSIQSPLPAPHNRQQQQQITITRSRRRNQRLVISLPNSPHKRAPSGHQQQRGSGGSLASRLLHAVLLLRHSRSSDSLRSSPSKCHSRHPLTTSNSSRHFPSRTLEMPVFGYSFQNRSDFASAGLFLPSTAKERGVASVGLQQPPRQCSSAACARFPPPATAFGPFSPPSLAIDSSSAVGSGKGERILAADPPAKEEEEKEEEEEKDGLDDDWNWPTAGEQFQWRKLSDRHLLPTSFSFPPPQMAATSSSSTAAQPPQQRPQQQQQPQHEYSELEDFDEDFVPRSSDTARQNRLNSMDAQQSAGQHIQVRRMSLKEFTGLDLLEAQEAAQQKGGGQVSQQQQQWRMAAGHHQLPALGSLIDKFSSRRRSSSSVAMKGGGENSAAPGGAQSAAECPYNSFDRAIEGISQAIQEAGGTDGRREEMLNEMEATHRARQERRGSESMGAGEHGTGRGSFGHALQRLTNIRNHLNSTLRSVPNVSPRKAQSLEQERLVLLNECRVLVAACKEMVRAANPTALQQPTTTAEQQSSPAADCLPLAQNSVDSAERMTESVELLIRKSNSIFQAQQLTTNADQLLKALTETVREVEKCQKAQQRGFEQARQLIRASTTLAANLIQFTELIRTMG